MKCRLLSILKVVFRNCKSKEDLDVDMDLYEEMVLNKDNDPVEKCCKLIESISEDSIINLYTSIDNFLFQDVDFEKVISAMPKWVCDEGISPEGTGSKDWFEKVRKNASHPIFNRFIYYYDLWSRVAAIQDRLNAVVMFLRDLYQIVPCKARHSNDEYTSAVRYGGENETKAYILLNSSFVAYASVFDILTKVAVEQYEFTSYDFANYKNMRSKDSLFNHSIANVDDSLKSEGMLFSAPLAVRKIETFRNEFVHNGPWDLRACLYGTAVNGEPADVVIFSPDMDEFGNFVKSGSRNKFYSQGNRFNIQLPDMLNEVSAVVKNTIDHLSVLYQQNTKESVNEEYTKECLEAISQYYKTRLDEAKKSCLFKRKGK